jgi:CHAT domain-containing protein
VYADRPAASGILLSRLRRDGTPQDGEMLRSRDLYQLDLPAELVTLSACRTALGEEVRGEGLDGFTQGFLAAGAARVLVSLWEVGDESTAELMERFYRRLYRDGLSPAAALRAAQLSMWREERWRAPYHWGAFVLQGEPR